MGTTFIVHTAKAVLPCTFEEYTQTRKLLMDGEEDETPIDESLELLKSLESGSIEDEEEILPSYFEVEWSEADSDGPSCMYIYSAECGEPEFLTVDFCKFVGSLLTKAGMPYLEFGWATYEGRPKIDTAYGGLWRLMADGSKVFPELVWPK